MIYQILFQYRWLENIEYSQQEMKVNISEFPKIWENTSFFLLNYCSYNKIQLHDIAY